jgi:cysteine sulfinate desulfinase/cysteine desulfurase-like protein
MTLSRENTGEEVEYVIETLKEEVGNLRKISPIGR